MSASDLIGERNSVAFAAMVCLIALLSAAYLIFEIQLASFLIVAVLTGVVALRVHFNYLSPVLMFSLSWCVVIGTSTLRISDLSRPIGELTYLLMGMCVVAGVIASMAAAHNSPRWRSQDRAEIVLLIHDRFYGLMFCIFLVLLVGNIVYSGYIPLMEGIVSGDTRYFEFGIPSVYGFFNAFANALALCFFFNYSQTRRKKYIVGYWLVACTFMLLVSRQNIVSLLVETFFVRALVIRPPKLSRLAIAGSVFLIVFSILGEFRSGSIRDVVQVSEAYEWLPTPLLWVFAYSYFQLLNLDNLLSSGVSGQWSGVALAKIIPRAFRPEFASENLLEIGNFTVGTYLYPVVLDWAFGGALLFTAAVMYWTQRTYMRARENRRDFMAVGGAAVLYFCTLFSFFENHWLYLPVIAQIPIIYMLSFGIERRELARCSGDITLGDLSTVSAKQRCQ